MTVPKAPVSTQTVAVTSPSSLVPQTPIISMRQIQDKTPQTLTTIKQQPSNTTATAPVWKAAVAVKRRGRPKAQPMATCQVLDTIEEVNEDSQMYPDLDFGKTESEAGDLCEILEENSDLSVDEPMIDLATDQTWLTEGYEPREYFTERSDDSSSSRVELVTVGTTVGATVPGTLEHTLCNALVDTGTTRKCLSEEYYQQLLLPGLKPVHKLQVRTASGSRLCPTGTITCDFKLGKQPFSFKFIICRGLSRLCILGLDFLRKYKIGIGWSPNGKFQLDLHQQVLVESIKVYMSGPTLQTRQCITIPSRSLMVLNAKATIDKHMEGGLHKVVPNFLWSDEYPELVLIPTVHNVEITETQCIPYILLNLSEEAIFLRKGEILGHLEKENIIIEEITTETMLQSKDMESEKLNCGDSLKKTFIASPVDIDTCKKVKPQDIEALNQCKTTIEEITTETMLQSEGMEIKKPHCDMSSEKESIASSAGIDTHKKVKLQNAEVLSIDEKKYNETMLQSEGMENEKSHCDISSEKKFITSPADVDMHRKVKLQDAEVLDKYKEEFEKLCEEYNDIFSKDSLDIGKTPLITMEIKTGDSPPVCQRPYNLPLKHIDWVQKELDTLEKAGVITRSVSPWASPIVIVPKWTALEEPPKKRLCVDYRVINSLSPKVNKAHSKAKGVLTLVPLPKIDEIYARLKGSKVYSSFDAQSGYHHMELSAKARPKSAFVTPTDKYEFTRCPFGLTQAPAYFQRLINKVLAGLDFAFGYLDDILIHSPDVPTHLIHMR